jgi:hypothetical protein
MCKNGAFFFCSATRETMQSLWVTTQRPIITIPILPVAYDKSHFNGYIQKIPFNVSNLKFTNSPSADLVEIFKRS